MPEAFASATRPSRRSPFFVRMSMAGLCVALIGFSTTLIWPLLQGTFRAPLFVYVHGGLFFSWLLLLISQGLLVRHRQRSTHRRLGWAGGLLALAMVVSGAVVDVWATRRDLAAGMGDVALGQFVNALIEMVLFGSLVSGAIAARKFREWHSRLMLLATISVLGPAWLRFRHLFPGVENPFVVFSLIADSVLLIAVVRDWRMFHRVHAAYSIVGTAMVVVHLLELFASDSALWLSAAHVLLGAP